MFPCTSQFTMTTLYVVECMYHYCMQAKRNMTPLMVAAREGHAQVVELLLSKGAEDNLKNKVRRSTYCTEPVITLVLSWKNLTAAVSLYSMHDRGRGTRFSLSIIFVFSFTIINLVNRATACLSIKTFLQHHATYYYSNDIGQHNYVNCLYVISKFSGWFDSLWFGKEKQLYWYHRPVVDGLTIAH